MGGRGRAFGESIWRRLEPVAFGRSGKVRKLIAIVCVVAWAGFWAFGYLALSAGVADRRQVTVAALLAAAGFLTGSFAYLRLARGER